MKFSINVSNDVYIGLSFRNHDVYEYIASTILISGWFVYLANISILSPAFKFFRFQIDSDQKIIGHVESTLASNKVVTAIHMSQNDRGRYRKLSNLLNE